MKSRSVNVTMLQSYYARSYLGGSLALRKRLEHTHGGKRPNSQKLPLLRSLFKIDGGASKTAHQMKVHATKPENLQYHMYTITHTHAMAYTQIKSDGLMHVWSPGFLLCRPFCPPAHRDPLCLCLPNAGIKDLCHHAWVLFFILMIYLFIIYEYSVAIFRHTRRGHQISLQLAVSHHVVGGLWTQEEQSVLLTAEPSLQAWFSFPTRRHDEGLADLALTMQTSLCAGIKGICHLI